MADAKISALPASTTPLVGTEVLPVVQSSTTKQVSVANLTAGRSVSAASLSLTSTPLAVTSGGSGTATAFTAGSVVFAGASGTYSQDNTNLFWDASNLRLGIGTVSPAVILDILSPSTAQFRIRKSGAADMRVSSDTGAGRVGTYNSNPLYILSNGTAGMILDTSQDVTMVSGNIIQGAAAKGINFTANTGAAGKTSQLLNWYEEGTWTPTLDNVTVSYAFNEGKYTRIGRLVFCSAAISTTSIDNTDTSSFTVGGLPFAVVNAGYASGTISNNGSSTALLNSTVRNITGVYVTGSLLYLADASTTSFPTYATICNTSGRVYISFTYMTS